jgi:uncharacterized damage-inducible protein DinB
MLDKVFTQKRRNEFYKLPEDKQEYCPYCGNIESISHMLASCPVVRSVNETLALAIPGFQAMTANCTIREVAYLDFQMDKTTFEFLTSLRYAIWLARNRVLFQNKSDNFYHVYYFITTYMTRRCLEVKTAIDKGWAPKKLAETPEFWKEKAVAFKKARTQAKKWIKENTGEEPENLEEEEMDRYYENIEQLHAQEQQRKREKRQRDAVEKAIIMEELGESEDEDAPREDEELY